MAGLTPTAVTFTHTSRNAKLRVVSDAARGAISSSIGLSREPAQWNESNATLEMPVMFVGALSKIRCFSCRNTFVACLE